MLTWYFFLSRLFAYGIFCWKKIELLLPALNLLLDLKSNFCSFYNQPLDTVICFDLFGDSLSCAFLILSTFLW